MIVRLLTITSVRTDYQPTSKIRSQIRGWIWESEFFTTILSNKYQNWIPVLSDVIQIRTRTMNFRIPDVTLTCIRIWCHHLSDFTDILGATYFTYYTEYIRPEYIRPYLYSVCRITTWSYFYESLVTWSFKCPFPEIVITTTYTQDIPWLNTECLLKIIYLPIVRTTFRYTRLRTNPRFRTNPRLRMQESSFR